jgi:NAD(P)-dependent dehydrogenase (short-subunit alcohol dehydrogenase family)
VDGDAKQMERLVDQTVTRHGRLITSSTTRPGVVGELRDLTPEHWRRLADVNILGVVYGTMAAYRVMVRQGSGHILNVSSLCGLMPAPILTPYGTTKWAVVGFSTSLRVEAAGLGVKISVACPSMVRTNFPIGPLTWRLTRGLPEAAARALHDGTGGRGAGDSSRVMRNQAVIVCPWHGRLLWWCQRRPLVAGASVAADRRTMAHPTPGILGRLRWTHRGSYETSPPV